MKDKILIGCLTVPIVLLILIAAFGFVGAVWFYGWNCLIAPAFSLRHITYLQGCAITLFLFLVGGAFRSSTSSKE